jgi:Ca2+-transporting ATPase
VITGDYASTAAAVLEKLGLFGKAEDIGIMEGSELAKIAESQFIKKVDEVTLFARTTPEQKLKIVQALKEKGEVVAMTGDGVNDAPALAKADIGIVVGDASDVSKETADMVLLDSNFSTIVAAVEEGRTIFANIKKVVLYLLSDSFSEVILIGGALLMGLPLPVTAAQILWINLIEDSFPAMALAFEKKEKGLMSEPPRPRGAAILDQELKVLIFIIGVLTDFFLLAIFFWLSRTYTDITFIRTVIFVGLGMDSVFFVLACRSLRKPFYKFNIFSNRLLSLSILAGVIFLALAVYLPPLQSLLKTHSLDLSAWFLLLALGIFNFLSIEIVKLIFIIRRRK